MKAYAVTLCLIAVLLPLLTLAREDQRAGGQQEKRAEASENPEVGVADFGAMARPSPLRLVEVLRAVADEAPEWEDEAAAASVMARVADLVWEFDPHASRAVLLKAWDVAARVSDEQSEKLQSRNYLPGTMSRRALIEVARRHAPELAERWLAQMAEEAKESKAETTRRGAFDDRTSRSMVLLEMAMRAAASDPRAAAELASASLQDGISYGFNEVLVKIQQREPALAHALFARALERLRVAGMSHPDELLILTAYLFTPGMTRAANTSADPTRMQVLITRDATQLTPLADSHPALAREFLRLAITLLVSAPFPSATANPTEAARAQISAIGELLHFGSQRVPEVVAVLEARRAELLQDARFASSGTANAADSPTSVSSGSSSSASTRATRDEELEEAARRETNPRLRDRRYAEAALSTETEKFERGFTLAGNISDSTLRAGVTDWLAYRAALHFVKKNVAGRAHQLSRRINDPAQRAVVMVLGAQVLIKNEGDTRARQWLEEALTLSRKSEPDAAWTRILFGVASTYAQFDGTAAVETLGAAVKLMNKSPEKPDATDERAPMIRRLEGFGRTNINFTNETTGFSLGAAVRSIPAAHFENVLIILDAIPERDVRGRAVVTLCAQHLRLAG